ncbi:MAG: ATP cone domain-containing protein [bacterium]|nr:ATP cone domain-containing protein [bacterium]
MTSRSTLKKSDFDQITKIYRRNGELVDFNIEKIDAAVIKAFSATKEGSDKQAKDISATVFKDLLHLKRAARSTDFIPTVELVQDLVEEQLIHHDFATTAKAYIIYRQERAKERKKHGSVPEELRKAVEESSKYFKSPYAEFIFYRTYSKWRPELGRRETWIESIDRFMDFMEENIGNNLSKKEYSELREGILTQEVCPSMRLLWSSGKACRESNVWAYNCSYVAPTKWQDLGEIMYILMCGAGLGFSVESENVQKFPQILKQTGKKLPTYVIEDSKEGWANAFVYGLKAWEKGKDLEFDYSKVRPAGARLQTAGGTASGPQPLVDLMNFAKGKLLARQGKRLRNIDLHDIICQIGLIVVAGGVRRSALISLSDIDDVAMRESKKGQFWNENGQRSMANNSAVYEEKPSADTFLDEWLSLIKSQTGERGIFNRGGLEKQVPKRRWEILKNKSQVGTNPCGEITLQSKQFCNLTSIVVRPEDKLEDLKRKVRLATMLGTYQATLTKFGYLSKEWKQNCEKEALLGVSITGYYDNKTIRDDKVLEELKEESIKINKRYAEKFGINESTCITTIKPHGNSGQLLGVGSGMHPWFAPYFIRRVRIGKNDPLYRLAQDQGVPDFPEVGYSNTSSTVMVLEFPVKSPKGAIFKEDVSALELLHEWKRLKQHYVEHNPSVTIYVGPDEWLEVGNFVYDNWEIVGGLSFLPRTEHVYQLAPYEEITKEDYEKRIKEINNIDFSKLSFYEQEDNTSGAKEFACVSGVCDIDDALAEEAQKDLAEKEKKK